MMMKPIVRFILSALFAAGLVACADGLDLGGRMPELDPSGENGVEISLVFPEMPVASTRAIGEKVPSLKDDLDLYLFVFDGNDLLQTIRIPRSETTWAAEASNRITFKALLPQTDKDAMIHIIAIDDEDGEFAKQVDEVGYGLEDIVMPSFSVSGNKDAYWQKVELGCPIRVTVDNSTDDSLESVTGTEEQVKEAFANPIPLIRNFASVSLESIVSTNLFEIKGWTVVNDLDGGSVVPWFSVPGESDVQFPKYADFSKNPADISTYNDLTEGGYRGVSLAGAEKRNTLDEIEEGEKWGIGDRFIYERTIVSVDPLYILLYGEYKGGSGASKAGYYKLSLAWRNPETGLVTEYNVLRNIAYHIKITGVSAPGYDTPEEAAAGPAFNDISGDVTTRNMTQISDGVDMLYVNFVNYVVTRPGQEIDFRYRYVSDITGNKTESNDLVKYDTEGIGIAEGVVVLSYEQATEVTDERNGTKWQSVKIQANDPTDELKQQTFTIYSPPGDPENGTVGLSRTINLILRNPWNFVRMETFPGLWDNDKEWPDYDPDYAPDDEDVNYYVGAQKGAPLTVFFELPAGLPEAMFPLDFQIESDRQNIENAGVGNAVVQTGPSLFPAVTDSRISFVKTVNWGDYAPDGVSSTPASRIIRARFVTTTNITSLADDAKVTTLRLSNPYFYDADDKFERNLNSGFVIDDSKVWDFSSEDWDTVVKEISSGSTNNWSSGAINGLTVANNGSNGNARALKSGGNETNGYYIEMTRTTHTMTAVMNYGTNSAPKKGLFRITASSGETAAYGVSITATGGTTVSAVGGNNNTHSFTTRESKDWEVTVPADAAIVTFTIRTSDNDPVRFYKIEYLQLGDSQ